MATEGTRSALLLNVAWAMFVMLPCIAASPSEHCSVSKILDCEETHIFMFQSGSLFAENIKCYFTFSTKNECNMAITIRDVNMAPPDDKGECTVDRLQVYDLNDDSKELVPGNVYCGNGSATNATEENTMSSNLALIVFLANENKSSRSFVIEAKANKVEATGTEVPQGSEGSESPGSNSTTEASGGKGNSTVEAPGGPVNTTRKPGGAGNVTETTPPSDGEGPPAGGEGPAANTTTRPGGSGNATETTPPSDGEGPPAGGEGPPAGGVGPSANTTRRPGGSGNATETTPPSNGEGPPAGGAGQPAGGEGQPAGGEGQPAGGEGQPAGGEGQPAGGEGPPAGGEGGNRPSTAPARG